MKAEKIAEAMSYIDDEMILASESYRNEKKGNVRVNVARLGLVASVVIVMILFRVMVLSDNRNSDSNLLADEETDKIPYLEQVTDLTVTSDDGKYSFDTVKISSGEMVILDTDSDLQEDEESILSASFTGDDLCYTIGYIRDGKYTELQSELTDETYSGCISLDESGNVCWCVLNVSEANLTMSGEIQVSANDLVFRDYGDESITVDRSCTLIVNVSEDTIGAEIQSVYLYNCGKKQETEIGNSSNLVYKVSESGTYIVYAVTEEGTLVNLVEYVTIAYEAGGSSEIAPL